MGLSVNVQIPKELENISDELLRRRRKFFDQFAKEVAEQARKNVKSQGRLAQSISGRATGDDEAIVEATAPYARAQEYGAYITPRGRATKSGRPPMLRFTVGGRTVYARAVRIPAKGYMKKAVSKRRSIADRVFKDVFGQLGG